MLGFSFGSKAKQRSKTTFVVLSLPPKHFFGMSGESDVIVTLPP